MWVWKGSTREEVKDGDKAPSLLFGLWADDTHLIMDGFWMKGREEREEALQAGGLSESGET